MHSAFNAINFVAKYHVGDDGHDLSISLPYLMGFVVVLVTLIILMGLCMGIGAILQRVMPNAGVTTPIFKPAVVATPAIDGEISPEILAVLTAAAMASEPTDEIATVIAAAAATMVDEPHRIISIKPQNTSWSQAGRQQIHSSHTIR